MAFELSINQDYQGMPKRKKKNPVPFGCLAWVNV
jgi:hypothetical protein